MPSPDVRLIPARRSHAALWKKWRGQAASRRYNPLKDSTTAQLAARIARASSEPGDRKAQELRWMVEADGAVVGEVGASGISRMMRTADVGYMLDEAVHGRGIGTAAVRLLLGLLFGRGGFRKLYCHISVDNTASIRLAERLGFKREGLLRQHFLIRGRPVDQAFYGLLRPEWRRRRP